MSKANEISKILKLKKEKILLKKLVNILLLLIIQTKFLLHYQHRLAL